MPESDLIRKIRERAEQSDQREKIILPRNYISWEYGSNKYVTQKGTGGFNQIRNTTPNIQTSRDWIDCYDVPFHMCPSLKRQYASQAGQSQFGNFRNNIVYVQEHNDEDKKKVHELLVDPKATSRIIPRLNTPNNDAKNDQINSRRQTITQTIDSGRRFTREELIKSRAAIPRFQCINETMAARDAEVNGKQQMAIGLHANRKTITTVNGLDRTEQDQLNSNRYLAWIGGQLTLQSQSQTAGFMKKRDVANVSYYDKLLNEASQKLELEKLRENERERKDEESEFEQNFTLADTERTIVLPKDNENSELSDEIEDEEE